MIYLKFGLCSIYLLSTIFKSTSACNIGAYVTSAVGATWPNHSQVLLVFFIYSKPLVSDLSWSKQSRASSWRHSGLIERKYPSYKMSKNKLPWKTFYLHWNTRSWIDQRFISSDQYISWKPQKNHWFRKINCGMTSTRHIKDIAQYTLFCRYI